MTHRGARAALLVAFFLSGASALIYQVVWQRMLTVHYGVGPASTALVVSVFMLGLGVGAVVGGRWAEQRINLSARYAIIELAIAMIGAASAIVIDAVGRLTADGNVAVTLVALFVVLLPPTVLMGATLPLLVKAYGRLHASFLKSVAMLYGVNTLGAAVGSLLAAYFLISLWGLSAALLSAAALNLLVAVLVVVAGPKGDQRSATPSETTAATPPQSELHLIAFATGFLGIGYEILWFRITGLLVKDSPYAFSTMLAVYLVALAAGSLFVTAVIRAAPLLNRAAWFASMQVAIALVAAASLVALPLLDRIPIVAELLDMGFGQQIHPPTMLPKIWLEWVVAFDIFLWPVVLYGVGAFLFGAGFPLLAALGLRNPAREGHAISRVYAANVLGNVAGGLVTGFVLLPWLKTEGTWLAFVVIGAIIAMAAARRLAARGRSMVMMGAAAAVLIAGVVVGTGPRIYPWLHRVATANVDRVAYFEEGVEGVVLTLVRGDEVINLINGTSHGGRPGYGFYFETVEALSHAREARHILVVGMGAGSVLEQVLMLDEVESVTLVEVNATLLTNLRKIPIYQPMLSDRRLRVVVDDGRRFLSRSDRTYDAILIDPLRTRSAYSNNLYSEEFYRLSRRHLAPGGVMMVWTDEFRVMPQTFAHVFPNVRLYDFFMLGSPDQMVRADRRAGALLARHSPAAREAMTRYEDSYVGDQSLVPATSPRWPRNLDARPAAEYFLGHWYRGWLATPWTMASWKDGQ